MAVVTKPLLDLTPGTMVFWYTRRMGDLDNSHNKIFGKLGIFRGHEDKGHAWLFNIEDVISLCPEERLAKGVLLIPKVEIDAPSVNPLFVLKQDLSAQYNNHHFLVGRERIKSMLEQKGYRCYATMIN